MQQQRQPCAALSVFSKPPSEGFNFRLTVKKRHDFKHKAIRTLKKVF